MADVENVHEGCIRPDKNTTDYHQRFRGRFVPPIFGGVEEGDTLTAKAADILAFLDAEIDRATAEINKTSYDHGREKERAALIEKIEGMNLYRRGLPVSDSICGQAEFDSYNKALDDLLTHLRSGEEKRPHAARFVRGLEKTAQQSIMPPPEYPKETECVGHYNGGEKLKFFPNCRACHRPQGEGKDEVITQKNVEEAFAGLKPTKEPHAHTLEECLTGQCNPS